ncbi:hypothetical protein D3C86_1690000 [compost metagenome]
MMQPSRTSLRPHLSESGPATSWESEKTRVNKLMESATSAVGVLNLAARAGNEGRRILIGKKLISEMQVMRMNRESC